MKAIVKILLLTVLGFVQMSGALAANEDKLSVTTLLQFCSNSIPNTELASIMDGECASHARKMCEYAFDLEKNEYCLVEVTNWMRRDADIRWQRIPDERKLGFEALPTAKEIFESKIGLGPILPLPDCKKIDVEDISEAAVCSYTDALAGWRAARIVERAWLSENENTE
ncbi:hypothetical protein [Ruegeria sp.]|uniref:hypothetical protein n=1 Tax=Ruegeria sp. TaxID=1879320 RepID=UPI002314E026|nr:hypothetical protein [Ruegeria sp.]MDA7963084.1 hypothetical protein [Ruegeria sp.]